MMDTSPDGISSQITVYSPSHPTVSVEFDLTKYSISQIFEKNRPINAAQAISILDTFRVLSDDVIWFIKNSAKKYQQMQITDIVHELNTDKSEECTAGVSAASAQQTTKGPIPKDLFDAIQDGFPYLLVFYVCYCYEKSRPCQVHDRPLLAFAMKIIEDQEKELADSVYRDMSRSYKMTQEQSSALTEFRDRCLGIYKKELIGNKTLGKGVGQEKCRRAPVEMFEVFKRCVTTLTSGAVIVSDSVLVKTIPYREYKTAISLMKTDAPNDVTCTLGGDTDPRGFDAATRHGKCIVCWKGGLPSCDAAGSAFDPVSNTVFAFEHTTFTPHSKGPHTIGCQFVVLDIRGGQPVRTAAVCPPWQFGHQSIEVVVNPFMEADIAGIQGTVGEPSNPFVCSYMPLSTLMKKNNNIAFWETHIASFRAECTKRFGGHVDVRNIPSKITHMGIEWILTAISQGPVSLNDTLGNMTGYCPEVEDAYRGCGRKSAHTRNWIVLGDVMDDDKGPIEADCKNYLGFTNGNSKKETGDISKVRAMYWTQQCLRSINRDINCSFFSIDYLAVRAITAPGLAWSFVIKDIVEIWGDRSKVGIKQSELTKIRRWQQLLKDSRETDDQPGRDNSLKFFNNRISYGLQYLAYEMIKHILLICDERLGDVNLVSHEILLIMCAALSSIVSSFSISGDGSGDGTFNIRINPKFLCSEATYRQLVWNEFDPTSTPDIFDLESFFGKLINLQDVLAKLDLYSRTEWQFDYATMEKSVAMSTHLGLIFDKHYNLGNSRRPELNKGQLEDTFADVDVLFLFRSVRDKKSLQTSHGAEFNVWLSSLFKHKFKLFVDKYCNPEIIKQLFFIKGFKGCLLPYLGEKLPQFHPISVDVFHSAIVSSNISDTGATTDDTENFVNKLKVVECMFPGSEVTPDEMQSSSASMHDTAGDLTFRLGAAGGGEIVQYPQGGFGNTVSQFGVLSGSSGSGGFDTLSAAQGRTTVGVPDNYDADMNHAVLTPSSGNDSHTLRNGKVVALKVLTAKQKQSKKPPPPQPQPQPQPPPTAKSNQQNLVSSDIQGITKSQPSNIKLSGVRETDDQSRKTNIVERMRQKALQKALLNSSSGGSRKKNKHNITKKYRTKTRKSRQTRRNKHKYKHTRTIKRRKSRRNNSN